MMRSRNGGRFRSVSYSSFALLAKMRLLDFARVVHVERYGRIVRRAINAPDLAAAERALRTKDDCGDPDCSNPDCPA